MRLYQTTNPITNEVEWHGSQAEGASARAAITAKTGKRCAQTELIEVPTNKADLLAWLNKHKIHIAQ